MLDFRPPKDTPFLIWLAKVLLPLHLQVELKGTTVEVAGDGLDRFKKLSGKRTIICPNHSNRNDPDAIFSLAKMAGEEFNFLAAREVFDWDNGWNGWRLQHFGCYSVVRGAADRESFKTTKNLIVAGKKKVVIFPEGEISRQNDTLMPLETGVAQMSFWAVEEMQKKKVQDPVFILPVAIKYVYSANIREELHRSLRALEERLNIKWDGSPSLYERLHKIALNVLSDLEQEYGVKPDPSLSLNERLAALRQEVLEQIASYLQVELPKAQGILGQVRLLRNALDDQIYDEKDDRSQYQQKLHEEHAAKIRGFYRDLDRVVNFIAIYEGYLQDHMTQERFAEIVDRFETEVVGKSSIKGPRLITLQVGEPIALLDYYSAYKENKKAVIQKLTDELSARISSMLNQMDTSHHAIMVD
jgi:1-acyl-sn-glycerol-3-phosphate acyltransferase